MADYNSSYTGVEIDRVIGHGINVTSDIQVQINSKEPTLTKGNLTEATSAILTILGGTNAVIGSGVSIEIQEANGSQSGYITSADWTTFNNKQATITGGASTITALDLTASRVLISNGSGKVAVSSVTETTLGYLDATSSIQTQLNGKEPTLTKGDLTEATSSVLTITGGTNSQIGSGSSIQVKQATTSQDGYLSSTDWNTFNNKQNALSFGDLAGTTNQINLSASGTGVLVGGTNVTLSLPQSINTTADITFNSLNLGGLTANRAIVTDASKNIISSIVTDVEVGYLSGVTSNIQDQINSKEPDFDTTNITGTTNQVNVSFGTDVVIGSTPVDLSLPQDIDTSANVNFANLNLSAITAERALIIDASNDIASSVTTTEELSFVNGVTSAIQTQLDSKQKELYKTVDASGNGDYSTLKEAVDANETAIFIKNGTYLESTPITINYDNVSIIGENIEGTILRFGAGEDGIKLYASYSEIRNLTMDAETNSSAAALVIGDGQTAGNPDTSNGNDNFIDHCRIMGSATTFGIYIAGASYLAGTPTLQAFEANDLQYNNRVTNCILESTWDGDSYSFSLQKNGEFSRNYCNGGRIAFYMCRESDCCNNNVVNSANQGIFVGCPAYSNNVNENKIYNATSSGFKIQNQLEHIPLLDGQRGFNNNFNGNTIFAPNNSGFEITGDADHEPKNNNFNDNTIYQADNHGFYLQDAHFNNFVGNTIYEPRSDSGTYSRGSGFYIVQNVENNNINSNTIIDERDPHVLHTAIGNREGTDCPNNNLIGNKIVANNTERTVWIQSNGWNISDNYISGGYYAGIYLDQADNCNVVGNICENNTNQANNAYFEIWLNNTASNNIVTNNTCISSAANVANSNITVSTGTGNIIENNIGIGTTNEYETIISGLRDMGTSTGIVAQTGNTSFSKRTLTGTTNEIDIADGDGVSGNPTFSLPSNVYLGTAGTLGRDADNIIDFSTDNQISIKTNGTANQLVVNSAGVIGVNTNDIEAWDSAYSTIQFPRAAIATGATTNDLCLVNNAYNDGAMKYRADGYAQKISLDDDGSINFNISRESGTADNTITWNNTLAIDANGLVSIENKNTNDDAYGFSVTTEQEGAVGKTTGIGYFNANGSYVSSGNTSNVQYGVNVVSYINSDSHEGTLTSLYGMLALSGIVNCGTGGTITNNIGVASSVFATDDAGTIDNSYMFKGKLISVAATPVTTINNNWGLYMEGCEDNYIEGDCTLTGTMTSNTFNSIVTNGDNYSYISASTPTGEAILYLTAGDGTTSSEVAYVAYRALESVQQTWMTGMFGDKNFKIKNHSSNTYPFIINVNNDAITQTCDYVDPTTGSAMLEIRSTDTATVDVGGNLLFGGYHNGTSDYTNWAGIKGAKENNTSDNNASYLAFYTQDNASTPIEQMRIDSNGTIWADMNHGLAFTGYIPKMYVTKSVDSATNQVMQITNTYNNYTANVTTKYPVLRLTRDGDLGNRVPSGVDFAVGCWEDSSTDGRSELNINMTHGTSNYPEAKVFSLLSSVKAYMGAAANPQLKFQLADYGGIDYVGTEIVLKYNTYYDGSEKWLRSAGNGCQIVLKDDGFTWYATNDSSTGADNAVTNYNTLMTLNNLGTLTQTSTYDGAVLHTLDNPSTGTSAVVGINILNDSDNGLQMFTYGTNHSTEPDMCLIQANAKPLKVKTIGSNAMTFYTNNIPVLTIDSSQNTNIASYNVTHQSNQNDATYHKIYNSNANASASALLQLANDAKTASLTLRSSVASSYANELTIDLLTGSAFNIVQGANNWLRIDSDDGSTLFRGNVSAHGNLSAITPAGTGGYFVPEYSGGLQGLNLNLTGYSTAQGQLKITSYNGAYLNPIEVFEIDSSQNSHFYGALTVETSTYPPLKSTRSVTSGGSGALTWGAFLCKTKTSEAMSSDFGTSISFVLEDDGAVENNVADIRVQRDGADDAGKFSIWTKPTGGSLAEALIINQSGNIGIATTDIEAWDSSWNAIEAYASAIMFGNNNADIALLNNAYYDGAFKYKSTAGASILDMNAGTITFSVTSSGTADTAITWSNALTIANSGQISMGLLNTDATMLGTFSIDNRFVTTGTNTFYHQSIRNDIRDSYVGTGASNSGSYQGYVGVLFIDNIQHQGTLAELYGYASDTGIETCGTGGTITNNYAYWARVNNNDADGTITNSYLYYGVQDGSSGTITNNWGIYLSGSSKNRIDGGLGVGATDPDSNNMLYLRSDQNAETRMKVRNDTSGTGASSMVWVSYADSQYGILCQRNPSYSTFGLNIANSVCLVCAGAGNTNGMRIFTENSASLILGTVNTAALTIDTSQNTIFEGVVGIGKASPVQQIDIYESGNTPIRVKADGNRTSADEELMSIQAYWDDTFIGDVSVMTGTDTTNKDDGYLRFRVAEGGVANTAMKLKQDGVLEVGGTTNNVSLDETKGVRQNGTTTTWDDLRVPLTTSKQGSSSKPDFDYTNVGYLFPQNDATEILYFVVQMPHGWKVGSTIYPHIHWQQSANQNVTWKIDYKWFNNNTAIPASFTTLNLDQLVFTYTSGNLAQISEPTAGISGTGKNLSSFLLVKLYRDDNVYTGDALAFDFDIHYEQDSIGSDGTFTKT